jgi:Fe2+ or Zn2+ uptake regulation protein
MGERLGQRTREHWTVMVGSGIMSTDVSLISPTSALAVLSGHGYRTTQPRREVVETVLQQTRPFTSEQMVQLLPDISRATIYRTLEIMASVDILTRLLQSNGHPAYVVGEPGHRHHLICSNCGFVIAFTSCPVEPVVNELGRNFDFAIQGHNLEIFGLCHNCR